MTGNAAEYLQCLGLMSLIKERGRAATVSMLNRASKGNAARFIHKLDNFATVLDTLNFPLLLRNTLAVAVLGTIGAVGSAVLVAYGFARFRIPGKNGLFLVLIMTIILPFQILLIPQYIGFQAIGWTGTWLPLLVPAFFANAYDVFLLRQYFMSIPKEMDEAAMLDGASPLRTLISVVIPQAIPAITAVPPPVAGR